MVSPEEFPKDKNQEPIEEQIESYDTKIVEYNLKMLNEDMLEFLGKESSGAGEIIIDGKLYPCSVATGYADSKTGKIIVFKNFGNMDNKIIGNKIEFQLRIADLGKYDKIIDFFDKEEISKEGLVNIKKAIEEYNSNMDKKQKE